MKTKQDTAKNWLALNLLCLGTAFNTQADVTIADHGQSQCRIVVPASAIPAERYATEELQRYLERMSGAKLIVVTDKEKPASHEILLGDNTHLAKLRSKVDFGKLGPDGFVLRVDGQRLIIAGGRPRGTLNGVYTLLEEKLGVRWFTSEGMLTAGEKILDEAEQLAESDEVQFRVQVARLLVWYVKIAANHVLDDAKTGLAKRFVAIARKAGISNISEQRSLDEWAKKLNAE